MISPVCLLTWPSLKYSFVNGFAQKIIRSNAHTGNPKLTPGTLLSFLCQMITMTTLSLWHKVLQSPSFPNTLFLMLPFVRHPPKVFHTSSKLSQHPILTLCEIFRSSLNYFIILSFLFFHARQAIQALHWREGQMFCCPCHFWIQWQITDQFPSLTPNCWVSTVIFFKSMVSLFSCRRCARSVYHTQIDHLNFVCSLPMCVNIYHPPMFLHEWKRHKLVVHAAMAWWWGQDSSAHR